MVFDGLMILVWVDGRIIEIPQELLEEASAYVLKDTGYKITLVRKPLKFRPEDRAALYGESSHQVAQKPAESLALPPSDEQLRRLNPDKKLFLFDVHGTIANKHGNKLRPGIESISELEKAGFQWCGATVASKKLPGQSNNSQALGCTLRLF